MSRRKDQLEGVPVLAVGPLMTTMSLLVEDCESSRGARPRTGSIARATVWACPSGTLRPHLRGSLHHARPPHSRPPDPRLWRAHRSGGAVLYGWGLGVRKCGRWC